MEKGHPASTDASIFDDIERLIEIADRSFAEAARAAVAENDRLGIPTSGGVNGKIVWRYPPPKL